jgi:hypothetical protein
MERGVHQQWDQMEREHATAQTDGLGGRPLAKRTRAILEEEQPRDRVIEDEARRQLVEREPRLRGQQRGSEVDAREERALAGREGGQREDGDPREGDPMLPRAAQERPEAQPLRVGPAQREIVLDDVPAEDQQDRPQHEGLHGLGAQRPAVRGQEAQETRPGEGGQQEPRSPRPRRSWDPRSREHRRTDHVPVPEREGDQVEPERALRGRWREPSQQPEEGRHAGQRQHPVPRHSQRLRLARHGASSVPGARGRGRGANPAAPRRISRIGVAASLALAADATATRRRLSHPLSRAAALSSRPETE